MRELKPRWDKGLFFLGGGTLAFLAVSVGLNYLLLFSDTLTPFGRNMVLAVMLPLLVCVPLLVWVSYLRGQVSSLRHQSNYFAAHDRLTGLPNGVAFSSIADRRKNASGTQNGNSGAFLIVRTNVSDGDVLKYGFRASDEAISLTAATIVSAVRSTDLVGRIGPDLFAIFLWGASEEEARQVGERIYRNAGAIQIEPGAGNGHLDLNLGGILFDGETDVDRLVRETSSQFVKSAGQQIPPNFLYSAGTPMKMVRH